ncbi:hypothetical protein Naga_100225g9 [Nannochloropsis gaditana]|uniref:Uncharacterized protein n=1 Tax=Nannochloropsis gaditana TaxID=72520 RepID=W7UAS9_9STRA|nr:hypothetical protein Naga_100225g9 [Nannochloropsis gaditana]
MLSVISRRCLQTQKRFLLRSSASVHPTTSFSLKACATWPSSRRRPLSTTAEAPPPPFPVASSLRLHDATTTKEDALVAWRTRRVIAEVRHDPQKLLMLLEMEGMDAYNVVILVSRLAQACEGKMEATTAVQSDPRFAQLVEQVLGGKGGRVVKDMSELQMDSVRASLRLLGVEGA